MKSAGCYRMQKSCLIATLLGCVVQVADLGADDRPPDVNYLRDIKPIFAKRCFACHGPIQQKSGLRLDTAASILKGGRGGPAVVAGDPDDSRLLELVTAEEGPRMPPEGDGTPLTAEEVAAVRSWIGSGARAPADETPLEDPRQFWSYQRPQRTALPSVRRSDWPLNPVDAFIAAGHEAHGLIPRPDAEPAVLLRRLFLDLIGLPPSRDELHQFLADPSDAAFQQVVEDLLARPAYGERWGRHWMDVWRYSDWYGSRAINEVRYSQRHIWHWRDWIVESINADKGYERMITEMLAGDELDPANPDVLRATGFLGRNWYKFDRNVWMFETVEQTSQAFLGLTLKCCRCHDHKYDPIEQKDYYRFRAFFEPHDVRTEPLSFVTATEKDATLGQVLKEGIARVYDKQADAPTYRFIRGDDRSPEKSEPLSPAVPPALGNNELDIQAVDLPVEAFYPALRPRFIAEQLAQAATQVTDADGRIAAAQAKVPAARNKLAALQQAIAGGQAVAEPAPFLTDSFAMARPDTWKTLNGEWVYENGRLIEKQTTSFATMVSVADHPRDFRARVRYRTLQPGSYRSVGFSFDYLDGGNSQDVYTSVGDGQQSVQAFHRDQGKQVYPTEGIVRVKLNVGDETTVDVVVRGAQLQIRLNGELKLDYLMPVARRTGKFALWVHNGSAEFLEVDLRGLAETPAELELAVQAATHQIAIEESRKRIAVAQQASLIARIAAEQAKYAIPPDPGHAALANAASRSEKNVQVALAEHELLTAEQALEQAKSIAAGSPAVAAGNAAATPAAASPEAAVPESGTPAVTEPVAVGLARKKRDAAQQAVQAARDAAASPDDKYAALGEQLPRTSTGRRLALAGWIASEQNPRTARVAVNQIWMRHFGEPIVPTVANFGLNGKLPSHPELLDWLAVEFMEHGWSMKHLHRLLVTSRTYRLSSSDGSQGQPNRAIDRDNRFLWRANSRRMEAEVVRDSLLAAAGSLDRTPGGPEIVESSGQTVLRRSLYFRNTPNEKMQFLELFDVANPNACYRRIESVVPNQALALTNSTLSLNQARRLARTLTAEVGAESSDAVDGRFIAAAFEQILSRAPVPAEQAACLRFLREHAALIQQPAQAAFPASAPAVEPPSTQPAQRARENLIHVLFSHNDFVTIR